MYQFNEWKSSQIVKFGIFILITLYTLRGELLIPILALNIIYSHSKTVLTTRNIPDGLCKISNKYYHYCGKC